MSITQTSTFVEPLGAPLKTILPPSGEKSGKNPKVVSCRFSVPFCFISQMPPGPHQAIDLPSAE